MIAGISIDGNTVYYGLDSALDFPLYFTLPSVIKALKVPDYLVRRYESLRDLNASVGKHYLVTFIDNHDQVGQATKLRFAARTPDEQVIAGIGYLLCSLGTPCIYYGTEQGFFGEGERDYEIREAMFDLTCQKTNYLNQDCTIYREIAELARIRHQTKALQAGRMYLRQVSGNGRDFAFPGGHSCTIAFSRILADEEYSSPTTLRPQDLAMIT